MVCAPVQRDNSRALAKARGLSRHTGAQTMLYLSLIFRKEAGGVYLSRGVY